MTLVRLHPWGAIDTFDRQLNRLFNEVLSPESWNELTDISHVPAAEISEQEEAVFLKVEIPGIEAQDLDIQVTEKTVAVSGERKSTEQGHNRSEFHYGKFRRVIPLPVRVDNTQVTANAENGILTLTLPKAEAEKNKVVKVSLDAAA